MNPMQTDLAKCHVEGNIVRLPMENLPNYAEVRKALLQAGAKYKRNTFIFKSDAKPFIDRLLTGENVNLKKEFQAFFTPDGIADWMAQNLFAQMGHSILEPSCGDGQLIKALRREGVTNEVDAYELNSIFYSEARKLKNVVMRGEDFLKSSDSLYDRILANPPFNKNQDIDHVLKMWECLAPKGRIVTVTSKHYMFANGKKEKAFRKFIDDVEGNIYDLESGSFKTSGTMVASQILILDKP